MTEIIQPCGQWMAWRWQHRQSCWILRSISCSSCCRKPHGHAKTLQKHFTQRMNAMNLKWMHYRC